ncbi:MAG: DUF2064 domain-containing protein [Actinomycetota bacterium]|nr:DUF2064 domain-containing protein [Acidimicrobiia bacterium]MDQ3148065.1 DUF2064 domain-containing protein [Actinomycetota bacterium]
MRPALIVLVERLDTGVDGLTEDAGVAEALLRRTLELARAVVGVGRVLLFHPLEAEAALTPRSLGFRLWPAEGDSPGRRYANAFRQSGDLGYEGALVIGLRTPTLAPERLNEVACLLERHQGVLVPDGAGGIAVLGLQGPEPALFPPGSDMPDASAIATRARQQLVRLHVLDPHPAVTAEHLGDILAPTA